VLDPIRPYPGFLVVSVKPDDAAHGAQAQFSFYDENGKLRYQATKNPK